MAGVSRNFIEELRNNVDIVDVISDYIELKKTGKNYKGLCPFHQEKTPSFTVNPDKQFYHCFGCGAGGDVFNFLMEIDQITFQESIKILAQRAGIPVPNQSPHDRRVMEERERIFEIQYLAAKFYHYLLMEVEAGVKARDYLKSRGFTKKDMENFYLGYAPDTWRSLFKFLINKGYSSEELIKAGLLLTSSNNSYYDRFRDRIIFPIFNVRGEVLGFGGRIIDKVDSSTPKYLNSPDTIIYTKGKNLYGLNWAIEKIRETRSAIIMEGYTDVLTAHKAGLTNSVASLGTALTGEQAYLLKRYASEVYIAYDADTAGTKATLRGLDILKDAGLKVKVIDLPDDMDPDDFISKEGQAGFNKLQLEALGLIDFKIKQILKDKNLDEVENRVEVTRELVELLAGIKDNIEREFYQKKVAEDFHLGPQLIKDEVENIISKDSKKKDKNYKNRYNKKDNKTNIFSSINVLERKILQIYINDIKSRSIILKELKPEFFSSDLQDLVRVLWSNYNKTPQNIFLELQNEELRKQYTELTVSEEENQSIEMISNLITKLKDYRLYQNKEYIYKNLQNYEYKSLRNINKLLVKYQQFTEPRKGGILNG